MVSICRKLVGSVGTLAQHNHETEKWMPHMLKKYNLLVKFLGLMLLLLE
jgi:hypothetical protein